MSCKFNRVLTFTYPIHFQNISLKYLGNPVDFMISWSWDGVEWCDWVEIEKFCSILKNVPQDFFVRLRFQGGLSEVYLGGVIEKNYSLSISNENMFEEDLCTDSTVSLYDSLECALLAQQQLSDAAICIYGLPAYYFKVEPDKETSDYTFKEYSLHNVVDMKSLKFITDGNELPSNKPQFSEWDWGWDNGWEIEISKTHFASAFGDTSLPKHRDMIYVPIMKKMWMVNSVFDERSDKLMYSSTTWKLVLNKWNENSAVDEGSFDDIIDGLVVNNWENVFGEVEEPQREAHTGKSQTTSPEVSYNSLNPEYTEDAIRSFISSGVDIKAWKINNGSHSVSKNYYTFSTEEDEVTYHNTYTGTQGMVSFIIEWVGDDTLNSSILRIGSGLNIYQSEGKLKIHDLECSMEVGKVYLVNFKWNNRNFSTSLNVYEHKLSDNYKNPIQPFMYYWDYENPVINSSISFTNGLIQESGVITLTGYPHKVSNVKVWNCSIDETEEMKEMSKYTTKGDSVVVVDLARVMSKGLGYSVQ